MRVRTGSSATRKRRLIAPAVQTNSRGKKIAVTVAPADTVFYRAAREKAFDAVVCAYHDQGLIPFKLLAFDTGVNLTLGLPIVRTSPDHGTALEIAGRGIGPSRKHARRRETRLPAGTRAKRPARPGSPHEDRDASPSPTPPPPRKTRGVRKSKSRSPASSRNPRNSSACWSRTAPA